MSTEADARRILEVLMAKRIELAFRLCEEEFKTVVTHSVDTGIAISTQKEWMESYAECSLFVADVFINKAMSVYDDALNKVVAGAAK